MLFIVNTKIRRLVCGVIELYTLVQVHKKKTQVTVNCPQNIGHHKFIGRFLVAILNFCFCCDLKKLRLTFDLMRKKYASVISSM